MGRLRKRSLLPEGTQITATLDDGKLVHGQYGRQIEAQVNVIKGEDEEGTSYKGASFKAWFNFARDKETNEEYISFGSPSTSFSASSGKTSMRSSTTTTSRTPTTRSS